MVNFADLKVGDIVTYLYLLNYHSDTKEKVDFEEAKVESIFLGRVELSFGGDRTISVWRDD